jgi:hypothetical protein
LRYALEEMFHTMVGEHMGEISIMWRYTVMEQYTLGLYRKKSVYWQMGNVH